MAPDTDPYRTLGLTRDATLDEVRRAYRRLAKANHPDAAGEAALPRFLAIQAAYDTIAGPDSGRRRPGAARPTSPRRAWDPDRDRADATYRAYGGRPRRARPTGGPGASRGTSGTSWERPPTGAPGTRPPRPERPPNKATLGSTSYDGADAEPFEPDWGGASWYGTTSGTYWTLNPKEYADPRKHGPEYQARARRELHGRDEAGIDPAGPPSAAPPPRRRASRPSRPRLRGDEPPLATHTTSSWWEATAGHAPRADGAPSARSRRGRSAGPASEDPTWSPGDAAGHSDGATGARPAAPGPAATAAGTSSDAATPGRIGSGLTPEGILEAVRAWLDDDRPGAMGRIARAIVGWAPIALGIGWVAGEISGCGRFAAGCDDTEVMSAWLVQIAALVALIVVGRLARITSVATLATLAAAIPAALLLSATGSPDDTAAGRIALSSLLVIAWVVGLVFGAAREIRGTNLRRGGPPGVAGPSRPVS